eukprot:jgi/Ulvmu1/8841/UM049_0021.1
MKIENLLLEIISQIRVATRGCEHGIPMSGEQAYKCGTAARPTDSRAEAQSFQRVHPRLAPWCLQAPPAHGVAVHERSERATPVHLLRKVSHIYGPAKCMFLTHLTACLFISSTVSCAQAP